MARGAGLASLIEAMLAYRSPNALRGRFRSLVLTLAVATGAAVLGPVVYAPHAQASVVVALTLPELVEKSDAVVVALPKSKVSRWEGGRIITYTTIAVDTAIGGTHKAGESLVVRTLGGQVGDIGQIAHGEAVLPLDKPVLLFLRPTLAEAKAPPGALSVVGMSQGAMPIEVGTDKIARIVAKPLDLVLLPKPGETKVVPASASLAGKALPDAVKDLRALWAARAKK